MGFTPITEEHFFTSKKFTKKYIFKFLLTKIFNFSKKILLTQNYIKHDYNDNIFFFFNPTINFYLLHFGSGPGFAPA
jgi:hypothetical protein